MDAGDAREQLVELWRSVAPRLVDHNGIVDRHIQHVLNAVSREWHFLLSELLAVAPPLAEPLQVAVKMASLIGNIVAASDPAMTSPRSPSRLTRVEGYRKKMVIDGRAAMLRTENRENGALCEIQLTIQGSTRIEYEAINALCGQVSMSLQNGIPLSDCVGLHVNLDGKAASSGGDKSALSIIDDPDIDYAASIADYLFRRLAIDYLGRNDLAQKRKNVKALAPPKPKSHIRLAVDNSGNTL